MRLVNLMPLTKGRREGLIEYIAMLKEEGAFEHHIEIVETLLAAEAYWREALLQVDPFENSYRMCTWCHVAQCPPHKPDCPWKLAQEEIQ